MEETKILVIGAGGLGCEILKDLALSGFKHIEVIDLDKIDVSNLNRQFLFRMKDVNRYKSEVAAEFIQKRVPGVTVVHHVGYVQKKKPEFYKQFNLVIAGLDNIEARRWINSLLSSFVTRDEDGEIDESAVIIPLIDGGTEGFKGQVRVILPGGLTSCYECTLNTLPPQEGFPLCTIAETPRKAEHCIAYAFIMEWGKQKPFNGAKLDKDSPQHMQWVFEVALARAQQHSIEGVTYMLTMGVVKNIIPAIASTNALVSAACVNEALKLITFGAQSLNNNTLFNGVTGMYSQTLCYDVNPDCPVCNSVTAQYTVAADTTLQGFIEGCLKGDARFHLLNPSVTGTDEEGGNRTVFMTAPKALWEQTKGNLGRTMGELFRDGESVYVTDPVFAAGIAVTAVVNFEASPAPPAASAAAAE